MRRRAVLMWPVLAGCLFMACPAAADIDWNFFKQRFVAQDGRVIDVRQDKISHSEGQGYAMLLAVKNDDQAAFEKIWTWTRTNIDVRNGDDLLAWSWGRRPTGGWEVKDYNNASDGDTLVAWSLMLAERLWPGQGYGQAGEALAQSIQEHLILEKNGTLYLLPGYYGFDQPETIVLNPSYWIYGAYDCFAGRTGHALWSRLKADALKLCSALRFGHLDLPADWVLVEEGGFELDEARSTRFGHEAVRVPLYLAWDANQEALQSFDRAIKVFEALGHIPTFVDLSEDTCSLFAASGGAYAVFARVCAELGRTELSQEWWRTATDKVEQDRGDYYSVVLYLLAGLEFQN